MNYKHWLISLLIVTISSAEENDPCRDVLIPQIEVSKLDQASRLEYLKRIDEKTWEQKREDKEFQAKYLGSYGDMSGAANYHDFDEARRKYLENIHYSGTTESDFSYFRKYLTDSQVKAWMVCQESQNKFGFYIIERSSTDTSVNLEIIWIHPPGAPDPLPAFSSSVVGGRVADAEVPQGKLFPKNFRIAQGLYAVTITRDKDTDLAVSISANGLGFADFTKEAPNSIAINSATPLGTIIASMLPPSRYAEATGDLARFDPSKSKWVPADGSTVAGSRYSEIISRNVPDLRGTFLRGLNQFEPSKKREDKYRDPNGDGRQAGDFQDEAFKRHSHTLLGQAWMQFNVSVPGKGVMNDGQSVPKNFTDNPPTSADGGDETRPSNIAIYYYIRIN